MTQPTGVFVRLHEGTLSDWQTTTMFCASRKAKESGATYTKSLSEAVIAIGTPVTGGELAVVAYADPSDLPLNDGAECNWYTEVAGKPEDKCTEGLVRQSDALAKLAEKDAEIARKDAEIERLKHVAYSGRGSLSHTIHSPARFADEARGITR